MSGEDAFANIYARGSDVSSAEGLEVELEERTRARLSSLAPARP